MRLISLQVDVKTIWKLDVHFVHDLVDKDSTTDNSYVKMSIKKLELSKIF